MAHSLLTLGADGVLKGLYSDEIAALLRAQGALSIRRVSHVEFENDEQAWFVEMIADESLSIKPFHKGPFRDRSAALAWESEYLESRLSGLSDVETCGIASKEDGHVTNH